MLAYRFRQKWTICRNEIIQSVETLLAGSLQELQMYEKTDFGPGTVAKPIYTIGSALAFAVVYVVSRNPPPMDWPVPPILGAGVVALIIMLVTGASGKFFERRHKQSTQSKRDRRAQLIFEQACQGRAGDYSLYLRAFTTTGQMPAEDTSTLLQPGFDPRDIEGQVVDLEGVFAQVLESSAPIVALGRPGEQFGSGRLKTEDDRWRNDLKVLADSALILLVLPSPGESLQWEIEWIIRHGHLKKSLFVMPPKISWSLTLRGRPRPFPWAETWHALRERFANNGITLPAYEKGGMIFFLGEDGAVSVKASLQGWLKPIWVARVVGALLNDAARGMRMGNAPRKGHVG